MKHLIAVGLCALISACSLPPIASATEYYSGTETLPMFSSITTQVDAGQSVVFTETGGGIYATCAVSAIKGQIYQGSATSTVTMPVSSVSFGNCTSSVTAKGSGTIEIHHLSGTANGTMTTSEEFQIALHIPPPFSGECLYGSKVGSDLGKVTGATGAATHGIIDLTGVLSLISGFPCVGDIVWSGTYTIALPHKLNVRAS